MLKKDMTHVQSNVEDNVKNIEALYLLGRKNKDSKSFKGAMLKYYNNYASDKFPKSTLRKVDWNAVQWYFEDEYEEDGNEE